MRTKQVLVYALALISLLFNLTACGNDPENYNEHAKQAVKQSTVNPRAFLKVKGGVVAPSVKL